MKKRIAMCGVLMLGGVLMFLFVQHKNRYKDLTAYTDLIAYTEKLLNIEWQGCIETAVGDVRVADWEDFANIRLKVKEGAEEKVISILKDRCGQIINIPSFLVPGYQERKFTEELKNSDIQSVWSVSMEGRRVKTRNVYIYVTLDNEGCMYIYIYLA